MENITPLWTAGQSVNTIADTLNDRGVATSRGGRWTTKQVSRVLLRVA
ncbi:recombinase family protein [Castellaniella sp. GW247-6E4]